MPPSEAIVRLSSGLPMGVDASRNTFTSEEWA